MHILRLDERVTASTVIQAYFRGYTIRCLRFAPNYTEPVAFRVFTTVNCDTDFQLTQSDDIYYWISI